ncbi:MAG: carbohydrate ABC transporter permease [Candidatus Hadarchaeum sp.]|uniref:carbohydrate ABC transporter permease n=1 Tax=Candidatus Hadarchaeum sp. TaxID=2883567 RepID=UPI003179F76B
MGKFLVHMVLILYAVSILGPVVWVVISSLKSPLEIFVAPLSLPRNLRYENYPRAWSQLGLGVAFRNSIIVAGLSVPPVILVTAAAAFALTRFSLPGRRLVLSMLLLGLMIPKALILVSLFLLLKALGMINTHLGLILTYIAFGIPFVLLIQLPFFNAIPKDLEEATLADGGTVLDIFVHVALPLARNGLIISGVIQFFLVWGEYVLAYSVIYSPKLQTLPLAIATMVTREQYQANWGALFAGFIIVIAPLVVIYLVFHRLITGGLLSGAIKG